MIRSLLARALERVAELCDEARARLAEEEALPPEEENDETADWPVPAQDPITPKARSLEWRPRARGPAPPEAAPLKGSIAARVRDGRGSG